MTTFFGSFDKEGNIIQITENNKNNFSWHNGPHPCIKAVGVGEWGQGTLKNVISTHLRGVDYLFYGPNTGNIRAKFNGLISEEKKADNTTPPDTGFAGVYVRHKGAPEWPPEELNIGVVEEEEKSLVSAFAMADIVFIVADAKVCLDSLLMVARAARKANTMVVGVIPRNIAFAEGYETGVVKNDKAQMLLSIIHTLIFIPSQGHGISETIFDKTDTENDPAARAMRCIIGAIVPPFWWDRMEPYALRKILIPANGMAHAGELLLGYGNGEKRLESALHMAISIPPGDKLLEKAHDLMVSIIITSEAKLFNFENLEELRSAVKLKFSDTFFSIESDDRYRHECYFTILCLF
jgi:cell division GTPase FtsZ